MAGYANNQVQVLPITVVQRSLITRCSVTVWCEHRTMLPCQDAIFAYFHACQERQCLKLFTTIAKFATNCITTTCVPSRSSNSCGKWDILKSQVGSLTGLIRLFVDVAAVAGNPTYGPMLSSATHVLISLIITA